MQTKPLPHQISKVYLISIIGKMDALVHIFLFLNVRKIVFMNMTCGR